MEIFVECPHCKVSICITELNCGVFRCGVFKDNGQQIPAHMPKEEVETLGDTIYGCGQPFQYLNGKLVKCGWI